MIEFHQTRTGTEMTIAECLAEIAAVILPITVLSSIVGMNVIVNDQTRLGQLGMLLAVILVMSGDAVGTDLPRGLVVKQHQQAL